MNGSIDHTDAERRFAILMAALRRVIQAADLQSKRLERLTGLTLPQAMVLRAIAALGEVTTARLSASVSLSQATVTVILDRLEARALVERYRSREDRRIVHARLTASGADAAARAAGPMVGMMEGFLALDGGAQDGMIAALDALADIMRAEDQEDAARTA